MAVLHATYRYDSWRDADSNLGAALPTVISELLCRRSGSADMVTARRPDVVFIRVHPAHMMSLMELYL